MSILNLFGLNSISLNLYPEAIIIFSQDLKIKKMNTYAKNLLKGGKISDISDLFDCDFTILLKELLQENNICTIKLKNSDAFVEIKATQKGSKDIIFSMRDVTQRHKTVTSFMMEYETSKKINRTKNNLLVKLDNELTAPLHSITGFSQAMLEGLSGKIDAKQKKYLDIINKNAFDLLELVEHLIEGAKLESNLYEFEMKQFDILDMATNLLTDLKQQSPNIKITTDFSKVERRSVYADSNVLKKIIQYFISSLLKTVDYNELTFVIDNPDLEYVKENGFEVDETSSPKNFIHISINTNEACPSTKGEDNMFEIYPQLEKNLKRDVLKNLPLYNASLLAKSLNIKLLPKTEDKMGFDILLNVEKN